MSMKSKKAGKQRKEKANAPLHVRHRMVSAHLSKSMRAQLKRRSLPLRKGDEVRVARGKWRGTVGKISEVDLKELKVYVEGVKRRRVEGKEVQVALEPSNLIITNPVLDDPRRKLVIERKR